MLHLTSNLDKKNVLCEFANKLFRDRSLQKIKSLECQSISSRIGATSNATRRHLFSKPSRMNTTFNGAMNNGLNLVSLNGSTALGTSANLSNRVAPTLRFHGYVHNEKTIPVVFEDRYFNKANSDVKQLPAHAELSTNGRNVTYRLDGPLGNSLLEIAHHFGINLEGACEGALACSTCHCIIKDQELFDYLGEPSTREEDMLDLAPGVTDTSRLGCQVELTPELMNWLLEKGKTLAVSLPRSTLNFYVDGHTPEPH